MIHDTQSAQISQKQDERNIYVIMKTMCPPGYHHNGFVATHELCVCVYIYVCVCVCVWCVRVCLCIYKMYTTTTDVYYMHILNQ